MKKGLVIVVTIVGAVLLGNVLIAAAQGGSPRFGSMMGSGMMGSQGVYTGTLPFGMPGGMMGGRGRMHGTMMGPGGMHEQVWTAIAGELGMTYDELVAAVQDGQTIEEIAEQRSVSLDDVKAAALEAHKAALADLVEQGAISQEQADWMLERMEWMPMFGSGFGPGGCHGGQGGPNRPPPTGNDG